MCACDSVLTCHLQGVDPLWPFFSQVAGAVSLFVTLPVYTCTSIELCLISTVSSIPPPLNLSSHPPSFHPPSFRHSLLPSLTKSSLHTTTQDGQIDADELQRCLTASGIGGAYKPFAKETCRVMIAMLDRDFSGKMGFNEFKELWAALNQWKVHTDIVYKSLMDRMLYYN